MSLRNKPGHNQRMSAFLRALVVVGSVLPWYSWEGFGVSGWGSGFPAVLGILGAKSEES